MQGRLLKKNTARDGNMADLIGTAICLLFILVIVITSVHFYKMLVVKRNIDNVARGYLLTMEEQGELTDSDISNLKTEIGQMGFSDIEVNNNNGVKSDHGERIVLGVTVRATRQELGLSKVYDYIKDTYTFETTLYSTSKN